MPVDSSRRTAFLNAAFTIVAFMGFAIVLFSFGLDFIFPNTSPGLNIPQLLLAAFGLAISVAFIGLRRTTVRIKIYNLVRRNIVPVLLIISITLLVLEFVLFGLGFGTYYPAEVPQKWLEPVPWWNCDETGCRYVYDELTNACNAGEFSGRRCIVNRQGYKDTEDFAAIDDVDERPRILIMGDSFTAGFTADVGKSYVEIIEANLPESVVWNTGISSMGTNHALASFETYAPLLRPQVAVLGFVMNDFDDNIAPIDSYVIVRNLETNVLIMIKRYRVDVWGNVIELDLQSDLYYRGRHVDPPASEFKRIVGTTRLGSLALRMIDAMAGVIFADFRFERKVGITREYLRELHDSSAEHGTALLVLLIPSIEDVETVSGRYLTAVKLMQELGVPFINPIDQLGVDDYKPKPDEHWNNSGHQKIGALLSACMETYYANGNFAECELVETPRQKT